MAAGVAATDAPVIVFLDADLVGLVPGHVDRLAEAVLSGRVGMACGSFDRGPVLNRLSLRVLPILTGQRALRREIFEDLHHKDQQGWRIEAALNSRCKEVAAPVEAFVCEGLWHRTKEEKYPSALEGFVRKQGMLITAVAAYAGYRLRKARPGPAKVTVVRLVSVNVGLPAVIGTRQGRPVHSGIVKRPVAGTETLKLGELNLEGDRQADLSVHGGAEKAVYAYASDHLPAWRAELLRPDIGVGFFGENLSTGGSSRAKWPSVTSGPGVMRSSRSPSPAGPASSSRCAPACPTWPPASGAAAGRGGT